LPGRAGAIFALNAAAPAAFAQTWPTKPVRIVVSFPPGTPGDVIARLIQPTLQSAWGQAVVVDNKPGAGGNLAAGEVAQAKDGHTLLVGPDTVLTINPPPVQEVGLRPADRPAARVLLRQFQPDTGVQPWRWHCLARCLLAAACRQALCVGWSGLAQPHGHGAAAVDAGHPADPRALQGAGAGGAGRDGRPCRLQLRCLVRGVAACAERTAAGHCGLQQGALGGPDGRADRGGERSPGIRCHLLRDLDGPCRLAGRRGRQDPARRAGPRWWPRR
jgi:hypothetical protein